MPLPPATPQARDAIEMPADAGHQNAPGRHLTAAGLSEHQVAEGLLWAVLATLARTRAKPDLVDCGGRVPLALQITGQVGGTPLAVEWHGAVEAGRAAGLFVAAPPGRAP